MNVKKSLESRIRGWFPQEPSLKKTFQVQSVKVRVDSETQQPPLIIPPWSNTSSKKVTAGSIVLWIIYSSLFLALDLNLDYSPSPAFQVSFVLAGLTVGAISGFFLTRKEVRSLSRNHRILPNTRNGSLLIISTVVIFSVAFTIFYSFTKGFSEFSGIVMSGLIISGSPAGLTMSIMRYFAYSAFEKKENAVLVQSWPGGAIFVIPKAPDIIASHSEVVTQDSIWKTLGIRIKEWFLSEPQSRTGPITTRQMNFLERTTYVLLSPLLTVILIYETVTLGILSEIIIIVFYIGLSIYWLKEAHGLDDNYRNLLLISSTATIVVAGLLLWLTVINMLGYWITSITAVSVFALLYSLHPRWSLYGSGLPHIRKWLSLLMAILGILLLISSLTLTSHVEDRLKSVQKGATIANGSFNTDHPTSDTEIQANLTTQERLHFEIIVGRSYPHSPGGSSVKFTISNQSLSSSGSTNVYFTNDKIGLPNDYYMFWSAPENGTYYFTLNYNLSTGNFISYDITKGWNIYEPVQVVVYTPQLAQYIAPTLIISSALLIGAIAIPIQHVLKIKSVKNKHYHESAYSP